MRGLLIVLLIVAISPEAFALEARWCSVSSRDSSNTLDYEPIAVAARIQGEAHALIIYKPNGRVEKVEPLSGVRMLLIPLTDQLTKWTVRSNASGDELCQTLVIATFTLRKPARSRTRKQKTKFTTEANTIHVFISAHEMELETDAVVSTRQGF
jgi:hypothetical protein